MSKANPFDHTDHYATRALLNPARWQEFLQGLAAMPARDQDRLEFLVFELVVDADLVNHAEDALRGLLAIRPDWANATRGWTTPDGQRTHQPAVIDAAWFNHAALVDILLDAGANPHATTFSGLGLLDAAAQVSLPQRDMPGSTKTLERLIARLQPSPSVLSRALQHAAHAGHQAAGQVLLDAGADQRLTNDAGLCAIDIARQNSQEHMASMLSAHSLASTTDAPQSDTARPKPARRI